MKTSDWIDWIPEITSKTVSFWGQSLWNHGLTSQVWWFPVFFKNYGNRHNSKICAMKSGISLSLYNSTYVVYANINVYVCVCLPCRFTVGIFVQKHVQCRSGQTSAGGSPNNRLVWHMIIITTWCNHLSLMQLLEVNRFLFSTFIIRFPGCY